MRQVRGIDQGGTFLWEARWIEHDTGQGVPCSYWLYTQRDYARFVQCPNLEYVIASAMQIEGLYRIETSWGADIYPETFEKDILSKKMAKYLEETLDAH